jgi:hypothetical protein
VIPATLRTQGAALRELLLMEGALARATARGSARRAARHALAEARDDRVAAEALLLRGSVAEAIRLGSAAGAGMVSAMAPLAGSSQTEGRRERLQAFDRALDELGPLPALDADTTPAQAERLRALLVAQRELESDVLPELMDRAEIARVRAGRWALALLFGVAAWIAMSLAHWALFGIHVRASSELTPLYAADRAVDGDAETEWVAGPGDPWFEITFRRPRRMHHLAILNGHILPGRAASRVVVQCFEREHLARDWEAVLGEGSAAAPVSVDVAGARCDRLVLRPLAETLLRGAAISEITFD